MILCAYMSTRCASAQSATSTSAQAQMTVTVSVAVRCLPGQRCGPAIAAAPRETSAQRAAISARPRPVEPARDERPPRPVTAIFAGHQHACALLDDGALYCWGRNDRGQCGQLDRPRVRCSAREPDCEPYEGDDHRTWRPARVEALAAAQSAALGESVSCAVTTDGALHCWGYHGAMRGEFSRARVDEMRVVRPVLGLNHPRHVHLGQRGGCVASDTGDVRCFDAGALEPETLRAFRGIRAVFAGTYQVCGWDGGESLRCHDINQSLTNGGVEHARFVATNPVGWAPRHNGREVCAWTAQGRVECGGDWGGYAHGRQRLRAVQGLRDVVQVSAGEAHVCARSRDGAVWCWGNNGYGQLGDGTTVERNVAVRVERLPEAVSIVTGAFFTCALVRDGRVLCWGANEWGQLGGADRRERSRVDPAPVLW